MHFLLSNGTRCTLSALTPKLSSRQRLIIVHACAALSRQACIPSVLQPLALACFQVLLETVTRVRSLVISLRAFCWSEAKSIGAAALLIYELVGFLGIVGCF